METASPRVYEEYVNGLNYLYDDFIDKQNASESSVTGCAVVLSYAPPDVVRQAKLEAMDLKVRRKMLESKADMCDPHALRHPHSPTRNSVGIKVSARMAGLGSRDLVKSLVVPPSVTEHGDEVRGSSEVILAGQRREYQRPGQPGQLGRGRQDTAPEPAGSVPSYRMYDPESKAEGEAEAGAVAQAGRTGGLRKGKGGKSGLAVQLDDGITYVPAQVSRPQGVESTAFVPQAQALQDARIKYESVRPRRPSSAPLHRSVSMATSVASEAQGGRGGGGGTPGFVMGSAAVTDEADGAGTSGRRDKWQNVPFVKVEETDLLAIYRENSRHLLARPAPPAPEPAQPPRCSSPIVRATIQTHSVPAPEPARKPTRGVAFSDATTVGGGPSGATRGPTGALSSPNSRRHLVPEPPHNPATGRQPRQPSGSAGSNVMTAAGSKPVNSTPSSPQRPRAASSSSAAAATTPPSAPLPIAGGRQAAWNPRGSTSAKHAATAPSPASPGANRPWAARTTSATAATSRSWVNPRPPSPALRPDPRSATQRRISAPSSNSSGAPSAAGTGTRAARSVSHAADSSAAAPTGPRVGFQPVDPETRRQLRQHGGAIVTAKTNKLRTPSARTAGGATPAAAAGGGNTWTGVSADCVTAGSGGGGGGLSQPIWATSSSSFGEGRAVLQERILDGLARQYIAGPEDEEPDEVARPASPAHHSGGLMAPQRRPGSARLGGLADGGLGGTSIDSQRSDYYPGHPQQYQQPQQQQGYHPPVRPQSAPNRRVRPPSAGNWAGRPDREALPHWSVAAQHSGPLGMVYDPELQPSPLDSYLNQLAGLD